MMKQACRKYCAESMKFRLGSIICCQPSVARGHPIFAAILKVISLRHARQTSVILKVRRPLFRMPATLGDRVSMANYASHTSEKIETPKNLGSNIRLSLLLNLPNS
jgi:hypothetical protein